MDGYWVCDACLSLNEPRYGACYKCRIKRGQAKPKPIIPGATVGRSASETLNLPVVTLKGEPSAFLALVVGTIATILIAALWYDLEAGIRFGQGRVAWLVGVLVPVAVLTAGTLGGRRRVSFILPFISFVLTLIAVVVGEYLIISHELALGFALAEGTSLPPGVIPVGSVDAVLAAAGDYLASDPLRPILWFLALANAWLIPWGLLVGSTKKE